MKKKITLLLLAVIMLLPFIKVKALSNDSYVDWNLDRSIFAHQYRNGSDHITNLAMITVNGVYGYCIEPGILADKASYYSSTTSINDTPLSGIDTRRLSLIGYYGYGYEGHNTKEYYMATQELIWRYMGVENVWWTDKKVGGNIINIDSYKNEILRLVNLYDVTPSFNFKEEYMVGDEIILPDNNKVLNGYDVFQNQNVTKDGNNIKIKVSDGNNKFTLKRHNNGKLTKFYYKSGYQTIGTFEFPYEHSKEYDVKSFYGKIIIDKLDDDTKSKDKSSSEASLEGAEYGLYDKDNNLLQTKKTDKDGTIIFDNLPKNNYRIKEISPSLGYTKSPTISSTFIGTGTREVVIKSFEKIIKNKIYITKVLDDPINNTCTPEEGILFYVFDIFGNHIMDLVTDKNGNIEFTLPYGTYTLRQISTKDGVDKIKDRIIEVNKDGITQKIALVNHFLPKPEPPKEKEEIPKPKEEIKEEVLPNTGRNDFLLYILLFSISSSILIYEKNIS